MKRFFYTTAAVVAFAFFGIANTIEMEETILFNLESSIQNVNINMIDESAENNVPDCDLARFQAYAEGRRRGMEHDEAKAFSWSVYFSCKRFVSEIQNPSLQP